MERWSDESITIRASTAAAAKTMERWSDESITIRASMAAAAKTIAHCPSEAESLNPSLVGESVSRDSSKGAKQRKVWCEVCCHWHVPIVYGGHHCD